MQHDGKCMKSFEFETADGQYHIHTLNRADYARETKREQSLTLLVQPTVKHKAAVLEAFGERNGEILLHDGALAWAEALQHTLEQAFEHYGHDARMDALHDVAQRGEDVKGVVGRTTQWLKRLNDESMGLSRYQAQGGFDAKLCCERTHKPREKVKLHIALKENIAAGRSFDDCKEVIPEYTLRNTGILKQHPNFLDEVERLVRNRATRPVSEPEKELSWQRRSLKIIAERDEAKTR
jgi:hypothetical protein